MEMDYEPYKRSCGWDRHCFSAILMDMKRLKSSLRNLRGFYVGFKCQSVTHIHPCFTHHHIKFLLEHTNTEVRTVGATFPIPPFHPFSISVTTKPILINLFSIFVSSCKNNRNKKQTRMETKHNLILIFIKDSDDFSNFSLILATQNRTKRQIDL